MGAVIEIGPGRFGDNGRNNENNTAGAEGTAGQEAPAAPPRRITDPGLRSPVRISADTGPETGPAGISSGVILAGHPDQARVMRRHLRMITGPARTESDHVESLASELFNNALLHSRSGRPGGQVCVCVFKLPGRIQVKISDQGPRGDGAAECPHLRPAQADAEGGFGLRMVAAQADRWGTVHEKGRTTVWFEIDRRTHRVDRPLQALRARTSTPTDRADGADDAGRVSRAGTTGGTGATGGANRPGPASRPDGADRSGGPA